MMVWRETEVHPLHFQIPQVIGPGPWHEVSGHVPHAKDLIWIWIGLALINTWTGNLI